LLLLQHDQSHIWKGLMVTGLHLKQSEKDWMLTESSLDITNEEEGGAGVEKGHSGLVETVESAGAEITEPH
jgi:hypothetical protein